MVLLSSTAVNTVITGHYSKVFQSEWMLRTFTKLFYMIGSCCHEIKTQITRIPTNECFFLRFYIKNFNWQDMFKKIGFRPVSWQTAARLMPYAAYWNYAKNWESMSKCVKSWEPACLHMLTHFCTCLLAHTFAHALECPCMTMYATDDHTPKLASTFHTCLRTPLHYALLHMLAHAHILPTHGHTQMPTYSNTHERPQGRARGALAPSWPAKAGQK